MSGFTRDSPQISASPYQLDFTLYASGSYNAQWNAQGLLRDKHTLRSSCILGEMEVNEPWLGLWLPLNCRVDMRANPKVFCCKIPFWLVLRFVLKVGFSIGCVVGGFCGLI